MSTRGILGFVVDGQEKITYNHYDSYFDGLGQDVLTFLREITDLESVREQARALTADPDADIHDAEGDAAKILAGGVYNDYRGFAADSLFCEYGYVINFDDETFEVFEGFQHTEHEEGRFAGMPRDGEYAPIKLVATYKLSELPSDLSALEEDEK